jgi:ankyrin repeat protein
MKNGLPDQTPDRTSNNTSDTSDTSDTRSPSEPPPLTAELLKPGELYEVTSFVKFSNTPILPGTVLKLCSAKRHWHEPDTCYEFEHHSNAPEPEELSLSSYDPLMNSLPRWLRRFSGKSEVRGPNPTQTLLAACGKGDVEAARTALVAYVPSVLKRRQAVELACAARSLDCVTLLASLCCAHPDELGAYLRSAAVAGFTPAVEALLDAGAPVNSADCHGQTALIHVGWSGHLELVNILLARGADLSLRTTNGSSALDFARLLNKVDVATRLEQAMANK